MNVLTLLERVYNNAYYNHQESYGAKVVTAIRDFKYSNGQPLNILKACTLLNAVGELRDLGHCSNREFNGIIDSVADHSGYTRFELLERIGRR